LASNSQCIHRCLSFETLREIHVCDNDGETHRSARTRYFSYVEAGLGQGRRDELTGGGLIRSLGGWSEAKRYGLKSQERIKSDERILGESDFVSDVLSQANEAFDRKYELKRLGYDMDRIAGRVAEIFEMEREDVFRKGKHQERVKVRSLFCYWMVRELGATLTELAKRLDISVAGVGYSVDRGERIARENNYRLLD